MPLSKAQTRQRNLAHPSGKGRVIVKTRNEVTGFESTDGPFFSEWPTLNGAQITVSEGHPYHLISKGGSGDIGGDFSMYKAYIQGYSSKNVRAVGRKVVPITGGQQVTTGQYDGPVSPIRPSDMSWPTAVNASEGELTRLGATAVARSKPTNSVADASVFLGELWADGLPHLIGSRGWKHRSEIARDSGSEYLGIQFGWLPLLSDVRSFSRAVSHGSNVMKQFERDSGKTVRRRYRFSTIKSSGGPTTIGTGLGAYITPSSSTVQSDSSQDFGDRILTSETVKDQWFSGAFTYYLPSGYDTRNAMDRYALYADKVLGISLSPEVLWNLAPWSWAADWFSNTGDVISNLTDWASDGLVMHYGYIMEHTVTRNTYSLRGGTGLLDRSIRVPLVSMVFETKVRRRANPFGFGVGWEGLSARQLSIAAALGLSRS